MGRSTCWCSPICGEQCWDGGREVEEVGRGEGMSMSYDNGDILGGRTNGRS